MEHHQSHVLNVDSYGAVTRAKLIGHVGGTGRGTRVYKVDGYPIPTVTTGSVEDEPLLILDPRNDRVRRVDFRELIGAVTVFSVIRDYLLRRQHRLANTAYCSLANAIPVRTLYRTYCMALLLLARCRAEEVDMAIPRHDFSGSGASQARCPAL